MTDVLRTLGREQEADKTNMHYMELKDSIMNSRYVINCEHIVLPVFRQGVKLQ